MRGLMPERPWHKSGTWRTQRPPQKSRNTPQPQRKPAPDRHRRWLRQRHQRRHRLRRWPGPGPGPLRGISLPKLLRIRVGPLYSSPKLSQIYPKLSPIYPKLSPNHPKLSPNNFFRGSSTEAKKRGTPPIRPSSSSPAWTTPDASQEQQCHTANTEQGAQGGEPRATASPIAHSMIPMASYGRGRHTDRPRTPARRPTNHGEAHPRPGPSRQPPTCI